MHFSRILLATDLSPASYAAFELAAYDRKMEGTEIILLHVHQISEPYYFEIPETWTPALDAEYIKKCREAALPVLKEVAAKYFHGQNTRCEVVVSKSAVAEEICAFAERENCDLIVMGSRGHTILGSLFVGSVVQKVLLLAKSPVIVVPPGN